MANTWKMADEPLRPGGTLRLKLIPPGGNPVVRPFNRMRKPGNATWIVERPERGDPAAWWVDASDGDRFALLMGLVVEKHFEVKRIHHKNCPTCGGDGTVDEAKYPDKPAAQCPACYFLAKQRVVIYR